MKAPWLLVACAALGCSRSEPPPAERTEPWRAPEHEAPPSVLVAYEIAPASAASLHIGRRDTQFTGVLPIVRGTLHVDLLDLTRTRGTVRVDVGALGLKGTERPESDLELTQRARDWLDVGASRPEAEREKLRWATFTIRSIENASATSAHQGTRGKRAAVAPAADGGDASSVPERETRKVTLDAVGQLELHRVRVDARVKAVVELVYEGGASFDARPVQIEIRTRAPLKVSLAAHGIVPRDSRGVEVTDQRDLLKDLGREAGVSASLVARPSGGVTPAGSGP